jgi:hypothetical protein
MERRGGAEHRNGTAQGGEQLTGNGIAWCSNEEELLRLEEQRTEKERQRSAAN